MPVLAMRDALNQALREVLGSGVVQRGSFVGPDHATFDFSFPRALTPAELRDLEADVNRHIRDNPPRTVDLMTAPEARATGAIALIDEKYGETVRVVDFGGWSRELCGGTHVGWAGDMGAAIIVAESSIGQGIRRIEIVAGESAEQRWRETSDALQQTARALRARPLEVPERVTALQDQLRSTRRELDQAKRSAPRAGTGSGAGGGWADLIVEDLHGLSYAQFPVDADGDAIVEVTDRLYAEKLGGDGVAVVLGPASFAIKLGASARERGLRAGDLAGRAAAVMGGRGGGGAEFGRGGIKDPARRDAGVTFIRDAVGSAGGDSA